MAKKLPNSQSNPANLLPQPPWSGPPLPRGVGNTWGGSTYTIAQYLTSVRRIVLPGMKSRVQPDVIYLAYKSITTAAANATTSPGILGQWINEILDIIKVDGKWSKMTVSYIDLNPPPLFWDYKCAKCRFYGPNAGLGINQCQIVEGRIARGGWCAVWLPPDNYKQLTWPKELLKGDW